MNRIRLSAARGRPKMLRFE
uniref:Uncharacterized protein n=1 Tax=Anguilla anguilla TaxID=7936 RepID=A0A0E9SRX6_ANGAN